jgi:quinoprotein glucose dehydrogenase
MAVALVVYLLASLSAGVSAGQAPAAPAAPDIWSGVFTADQAERGRAAFAQNCAECHGASLEGGEGKALSGDRFWRDWQEAPVDYMFGQISRNMPFSEDGTLAGTLPRTTYIDLVSHILNTNGFPAGDHELTPESAVGVRIVPKGGSRELPALAAGHVVGCLARGEGGKGWVLTKGSRAERVLSTTKPDTSVALGDRVYPLLYVLTPVEKYVGYKMSVTGQLQGEGGVKGINVNTITPVSEACQ